MSLTKVSYSMINGEVINVLDYGADLSGTNDSTTAIQAAIDFAYANGGGVVYLSAGDYKTTGVVCKDRVSIKGDGQFVTTFNLIGTNSICISSPAQATMLASGTAFYGTFENFNISFSDSTQIGVSYVGLSRWTTKNVSTLMNTFGATGFKCLSTTTAGVGGPAQWYNSFYDCNHVGTATARTNGAIGWDIGGDLATDEQATTWNIHGGRTNLCEYGVKINGVNGINFYGHTTESNTNNWYIGYASGRTSRFVSIYCAYIEGGTDGINIGANGFRCSIINPNITSLSGAAYADSGQFTQFIDIDGPSVLPYGLLMDGTNPSSNVNVLDYYEEGAWTPTLEGNSTAGSYTLATTGARYTRIGNLMTITFRATITVNSAGTGFLKFSGLPYAKSSNQFLAGSAIVSNIAFPGSSTQVTVAALTSGTSSDFGLQGLTTSGAAAFLDVSGIGASASIVATFQYFV